jgi:tyrosyl-tRNA synthetase
MSKSLGNYVGITDQPEEMFGKVMSISDELMWRWLELLSFRPMSEIDAKRKAVEAGANPRDIKVEFAQELVARFHTKADAEMAHRQFVERFRKGNMPDEIEIAEITVPDGGLPIANLLKEGGLVKSTSEALRMIKQGAVKIDGEKVSDPGLVVGSGVDQIYQVGKRRFLRMVTKIGPVH